MGYAQGVLKQHFVLKCACVKGPNFKFGLSVLVQSSEQFNHEMHRKAVP